jgi:RNA polymerase sigma-70 factor (ECF subfamily)
MKMETHRICDNKTILWEEEQINKAKINPQYFAPIYSRYYDSIFRYIYKRVNEQEAAFDLTSCVFIKALSALNKYEFRGIPFSSWLFRIAKSEVYQSFRDKKVINLIHNDSIYYVEIDEEIFKSKDDEFQLLKKCLENLKINELQLIEMRFFEKMSFREIGEDLGITENNAKVKTFRVLAKLKKNLIFNKNDT